MKAYRNSIYVFLILTFISLGCYFYFPVIGDLSLAIFGSSLVSLFTSFIFYYYEKQEIIKTLGIKSASLYSILNSMYENTFLQISESKTLDDFKIILSNYNAYSPVIANNSIKNELNRYSGLLSCKLFYKIYANKEIKTISSLWSMEENLISLFPKMVNDFNLELNHYVLALCEQNLEKQKEHKENMIKQYNLSKKSIPLQLDFIDTMLKSLFSYNLFNISWSDLKKQITNHEGISNVKGIKNDK